MKKIVTIVGILVLPIILYAHDIEVDGVFYNILSKIKAAEVTYKGDAYWSAKYSGDVVIPCSIDYNGESYTVISIGVHAFANCNQLSSI